MARSWTVQRLDGTTVTRSLPDALTPMVWQGFIAVTNPLNGTPPKEIHAPGSGSSAIVIVRLTTPPSPGTAYTYTLTPLAGLPAGFVPITFTLPDNLGIDQFSMEGKGAVSITRAVSANPAIREPILVARADMIASVTVSPLD